MGKSQSKKPIERRKRGRSEAAKTASVPEPSLRRRKIKNEEICQYCSKDLRNEERALFVEEEIGRIFCSEGCIASYFAPEVQRLETEFFQNLSPSDLTGEEREKFAHLRWVTLQEPDEVWREKTLNGDYRFTLISEFKPSKKPIWCVCICLLLRGEPSFLYLAFPTKNSAMVNEYRKGERVEWVKLPNKAQEQSIPTRKKLDEQNDDDNQQIAMIDGLAEAWTEDETLRAQLIQKRRADDIPSEEFSLYQTCLEETLESPDEVWTLKMGEEKDSISIYHFMRHYPAESPEVWYIIVARETEDETQIEILDAFPTRDRDLMERYRRGEQEVGFKDTQSYSRLVH